MKKIVRITVIISLLFFASCEEHGAYDSLESTVALAEPESGFTSEPNSPLYSTAAEYAHPDKEFIRTADLSMEVKDVYASTVKIEQSLAEMGGFVENSELETRIHSIESFTMSQDSLMEVKTYHMENRMTLKIPEAELGHFLISLGEEMEFLDHRIISLDDVTLNTLYAQMKNERREETNEKLNALLNEQGKIKEKEKVIRSADKNRAEADMEKIQNLRLRDEIAFSTVDLLIREKEKVLTASGVNAAAYSERFRPTLTYRMTNAVKGGYLFLESLLVGILYLWPLWLIGIPLFVYGRKAVQKFVRQN